MVRLEANPDPGFPEQPAGRWGATGWRVATFLCLLGIAWCTLAACRIMFWMRVARHTHTYYIYDNMYITKAGLSQLSLPFVRSIRGGSTPQCLMNQFFFLGGVIYLINQSFLVLAPPPWGGLRGVRGSIPAWSGLGWAGLMRCWYLVWVTVDDEEEARQGGRLSGFSCGWWGWCWW